MPVQACKTPAYVAGGHRYPFTASDDKEREAAKKKAAKYGTPKRVTLSGYSWGDGKCYDFAPNDEAARKRAFAKAAKQGRAIKRSQSMRGGDMDGETIKKIFGAKKILAADETAFRQVPYWSKTLTPEDIDSMDIMLSLYYSVGRMQEVKEFLGPHDRVGPGHERWSQAENDIFNILWAKGLELAGEIDAGKVMTFGEFIVAGEQAVLDYIQGKGVDLGLAPFSEQVLKEVTPDITLRKGIGIPLED